MKWSVLPRHFRGRTDNIRGSPVKWQSQAAAEVRQSTFGGDGSS
jgi:hypothetical protein